MTEDDRHAALRIALESELARAGLVRTPEEVARLLCERAALERAIERQRARLNPLLAPDAFVERVRTLGAR